MSAQITEIIDFGKPIAELFPPFNDLEVEKDGGFTWKVENWNTLENKVVSPSYAFGGFSWDVLLFPNGNNNNKCLAVYLEPKPVLPFPDNDWSVCAQFSVIISRPDENSVHVVRNSYHRFSSNETDWGFSDFMELDKLKNRYTSLKNSVPTGLIIDGEVNISVYIRIIKDETGVLWHNFVNYDSKKVTGFVGFNNQGATCYLNSLLQTYFFTKKFRKLVYAIPTKNDTPSDSVALALQRAFYLLETSDTPLDTLELTKSFGWDNEDAFTQHDIQELNRILMDKLESKMNLKEMFVGKMKSYIKCINIDYESSRVEDFWDIQLNVKNMKNLEQSFENYIEVERLEGENQYQTEGFGLQDAEKGVIFESFPPVLYLQLKRFEYDFNFDRLVKINDRYEFPESIDLSPYGNGKVYDLQGVLVHSGDIDTGHYYAMIKPKDQWYRFDDDRVWKVTKKSVFDENFGYNKLTEDELKRMTKQKYQNYLLKRQTSAYMLVYIEREIKEEILQDLSPDDVPRHVAETFEHERQEEEKRKLEIQEMREYYNLKMVFEKDFLSYEGFDLFPNPQSKLYHPDLYDQAQFQLKVLKSASVADVKKQLGCRNIWIMGYRQSSALRVFKRISDDGLSIENAFAKEGISKCLDVILYGDNNEYKNPDSVLLFVKLLESNVIKGYTTLNVQKHSRISDIYSKIKKDIPNLLPYCYEEISPNEIEELDLQSTVLASELTNGDILTFGAQTNIEEVYSYLRFRIRVNFTKSPKESDYVKEVASQNFSFWVSAKCSYIDFAKKCAAHLNVDWEYVRIMACYENGKLVLNSKSSLDEYLVNNYSFATIPLFEFEVLSIPLAELENLNSVKVRYFGNNYIHYTPFDFQLPGSSTIADLKKKISQKINGNDSDLQLWTNVDHKFHGLLSDETLIEHIGDVDIYARGLTIDETKKLVLVIQFFKTLNRTHGVSFLFEIMPEENVTNMSKRLHDIFGLGQKEFAKIKLSLFSHSTKELHSIYEMSDELKDTTIPYDILDTFDVLFMDHPDRSRSLSERSIIIK